jgi:hypothetical protein
VYVVDLGDNVLKIGRTKDVCRRLKQYKTHHANGVPLLLVIPTENAVLLEKKLHMFARAYGLRV